MRDKETRFHLLTQGSIQLVTDEGEVVLDLSPSRAGKLLFTTPYAEGSVSVFDKGGETVYRGLCFRCLEGHNPLQS